MEKSTRRKFLARTSVTSLGILGGLPTLLAETQPKTAPISTSGILPLGALRSKRDLMMQVLDMSHPSNYIPAGFFMHFGVKGDAAVKAHLDYFHATGMDFLKIQFDEQGLAKNEQIKTASDWAKMPILTEKWFEPSLYLLKALIKNAKREAIILQTVYSPYQMAKQAVPWEVLVAHVKEDPDSVCRGMENITLSIMNFIHAAVRLGVDGFYTCTQGGETNRVADQTLFNRTIKNYDMILYKEVSQLVPFNILHICDYDGSYEGFAPRFQDYPGQVVNVPLFADNQPLSLSKASKIFNRPVIGGLDRHGILTTGSPEEIKKATIEVLKDAPANMILGADCTVDRKIPIENLKAAINTAHEFRR